MFSDHNIWFLLGAILPALFYGFVVFIHTPRRSVELKQTVVYATGGLLALTLVWSIDLIFPNWGTPLISECTYPLLSLLVNSLIQVALLEEGMKYLAFLTTQLARNGKVDKDHPIGTMFYAMMVSVGFAVLEAFHYALRFEALSESGTETLLARAYSSTIVHMVVGLVLGYWVARSKTKGNGKAEQTEWGTFLSKRPRVKAVAYTVLGILFATIIHGVYNFTLLPQLYSHGYYSYIIVGGLILGYLTMKDLKQRTQRNETV